MNDEEGLGREVTGSGLMVLMNAISPSLLPFQNLDPDQTFPTSLFVSLFGEEENWLVRGEEVGGALLRELHLIGSMNTERALAEVVRWFAERHPGSAGVHIEKADYRGAEVVLKLDYPPNFLLGILQRIAWGTRGKEVAASEDSPYRFAVRF